MDRPIGFRGASGSIRWGMFAPGKIVAGKAVASPIRFAQRSTGRNVRPRVGVTTPQGERSESATLPVTPAEVRDDPRSCQWALGVQLMPSRRIAIGAMASHRPLGLNRLGKRTRRRCRRAQPASLLFRGEPLFAQQSAASRRSRYASGVRRALLDRLCADEAEQARLFEFVLWLTDHRLCHCCKHARDAGLSIGLHLDVAVGVRPDGFDAWSDQSAPVPNVAVGAWGLAAFNRPALPAGKFATFALMDLATAMRQVARSG